MAADKTLVQGAYKAAGGGRPSDSAAAFDALDQINSTVNELIVKPEQKRRSDAKANAKKMADEILANGGSLNSQTFDALYPQVQNLQEQYYQAVLAKDDQAAAKIMMQMNQMSTSIQSGKDIAKTNAEAISDGLASDAMTKEELRNAQLIHDPKAKHEFGVDADGNPTHHVLVENEDGTIEKLDFNAISESLILKDNDSKKSLNEIALKELDSAGKGGKWNENAVKLQVRNVVDGSKNLRSLMHDQVIGGDNSTKFVNAIAQNPDLVGLKYEDLDASQFELEEGETNWSDNISEADQALIVDAITNPKNEFYDEELSKNLLTDYFTNFAKKQHGESFVAKEKTSPRGKERTPISASEMNKYNTFIRGINDTQGGRIVMPDGLTYALPNEGGGYSLYSRAGNEKVPGSDKLSKRDIVNLANIPNSLLGKIKIQSKEGGSNPLIKN